jgi:hypothetical protein
MLFNCAEAEKRTGHPSDSGGSGEEQTGGTVATGGSRAGSGGGSGGAATGGAPAGTAGSPADAASSTPPLDAASPPPADGGATVAGDGGLPPARDSPLTVGWTQKTPMWKIHSPYDLPPSARVMYDPVTMVHTMFVNANDKPMAPNKTTDPRAEYQWNSYPKGGKNMFDADVWIEPNTDATCIMQVFMTTPSPTSMMLSAWEADGGSVRHYGFGTNGAGVPIVNPKSHGHWWNLKVLHDTSAGMIEVYVDDVKSQTFSDRGGSNWYFKNGVYGTSGRSETRWRNIRWWFKP